jgi:hypothetical protein
MKLSKERKKELQRIYEEKIDKEYVKELKKQPLVSPMEFVDIIMGVVSQNKVDYSVLNSNTKSISKKLNYFNTPNLDYK